MVKTNGDSKIVTGNTIDELNEKVKKEMVEQGWQAEGPVITNDDGTFSQKLVK